MQDDLPQNIDRARELFERGNQFARENHVVRAMDEWKEAVRLNPKLMDARLALGTAYADAGEYDRAVEQLEAAYELDPENRDVRQEYVQVLNERGVQANERGDSVSALRDWDRALEVDPDDGDTHYNLGTALADSGDYTAAEEHLRSSIRATPTDLEARYRLAQVLAARGRENDALGELREALYQGSRINQALASTHMDAQEGLLVTDPEKLRSNARELQGLDERLAGIARMAAEIYLKRGEYDQATSALEQAPFTREAAPLWLQVGRRNIQEDRGEDAVLALRRAYQCDPELDEPRVLLDRLGAPYVAEEEAGEDEDEEQAGDELDQE